MSKDNLEQKAILIDLMNSEPLMSAGEWLEYHGLNYANYDFYYAQKVMKSYANYHTQWHLKQVEKVVVDRCHFISTKYNTLINETIIKNAFDNYITNNLK